MKLKKIMKVIRITCRKISSLLLVLILLLGMSPHHARAESEVSEILGVAVIHRSGQTFVTWTESATLINELYTVYRSNEPITVANIHQARVLLAVPEDSARFYANRFFEDYIGPWNNRYLDRLVIADNQPQLPPGTGLLVWTLNEQDFDDYYHQTGYYAVTYTPQGGSEVFDPQNVAGPIAETVQDPAPIRTAVDLGGSATLMIQYMDLHDWNPTFHAPNSGNLYYGFNPDDFKIQHAVQYAYDYVVSTPTAAHCGGGIPALVPLVLHLHSWGDNTYDPFFPGQEPDWCATIIWPVDMGETWFFGFARNNDYRVSEFPHNPDVISNYTEQRLLRMIHDQIRSPVGPAIDPARVFVQGASMGASGALAMSLRYPDVFAAAYSSQPMTDMRSSTFDQAFFVADVAASWGWPADDLPILLDGPNGWADHLQDHNGESVWDWQNHLNTIREQSGMEVAPLSLAWGIEDIVMDWPTQGRPSFEALNASRQCWGASISNDGHHDQSYRGLLPNYVYLPGSGPFWGLQARNTETIPGLSDASANPPLPPPDNPPAVPGDFISFNATIRWAASWDPWDAPPVDEPERWEMSLCAIYSATSGCGTGIVQSIDVTPRRVQQFKIRPAQFYRWENWRLSDATLYDAGIIAVQANGLLTIPDAVIFPQGSRLVLFPIDTKRLFLPAILYGTNN